MVAGPAVAQPAGRRRRPCLDRAELAFVFGQIAPGKVAAPNPALTFRVESPFAADSLDGTELTDDELVYRVISHCSSCGATCFGRHHAR